MMTFERFITSQLIIATVLGILQGQVIGYDLFEGSECRLTDKSLGICTKLPECSSLYNGLIAKSVQYSDIVRCSFVGSVEVVCCGDRKPSETTKKPLKPSTTDDITFPHTTPIAKQQQQQQRYENIDNNKSINNSDLNNSTSKRNNFNEDPGLQGNSNKDTVDESKAQLEGIEDRFLGFGGFQISFPNRNRNGVQQQQILQQQQQQQRLQQQQQQLYQQQLYQQQLYQQQLLQQQQQQQQYQGCNVAPNYESTVSATVQPSSVGSRFGLFNWGNRNTGGNTTPRSNSPLKDIINSVVAIKTLPLRILSSAGKPQTQVENSQINPSFNAQQNINYDPCNPYINANSPISTNPNGNLNNFGNQNQGNHLFGFNSGPIGLNNEVIRPTNNIENSNNILWNQQSQINQPNTEELVQVVPTTSNPPVIYTLPSNIQFTTTTTTTPRAPVFDGPVWDVRTEKSIIEQSTLKGFAIVPPITQSPISFSSPSSLIVVDDSNNRNPENTLSRPIPTFNDFGDNIRNPVPNLSQSITTKNPVLDPWMQQALSPLPSSTTKRTTIETSTLESWIAEALEDPPITSSSQRSTNRTAIDGDNSTLEPWIKDALSDSSSNKPSRIISTLSPSNFQQNSATESPTTQVSSIAKNEEVIAIAGSPLDPWMREALARGLLNHTSKNIVNQMTLSSSTTQSTDISSSPFNPWIAETISAPSSSNPTSSSKSAKLVAAEDLNPLSKQEITVIQNPTPSPETSTLSRTEETPLDPWIEEILMESPSTFQITTKRASLPIVFQPVPLTQQQLSETKNSSVNPSKREFNPTANTLEKPPNMPSTSIVSGRQPTAVVVSNSTRSPNSNSFPVDYNEIYPSMDNSGPSGGGDTGPDSTESRGKLGKVEEACEKYRQEKARQLSYHILGGKNTSLGEFPHMAALGYPSTAAGQDFEWKCGASLISDLYVLTAAHCIRSDGPTVVRLGIVNLISGDPVDRAVDTTINHPMYKSSRQYHDISLVRMTSSVEFTDIVFPACLNSELRTLSPNTEVWVTGWGVVESGQKSQTLLKANLTITDFEECNKKIVEYQQTTHTTRRLPDGLNEGQFCAYDPGLTKDACQGDSGGPLQMVDKDGVSTVYGVISFGVSCANEIPGVYAKVSYYIDWIESVVWE